MDDVAAHRVRVEEYRLKLEIVELKAGREIAELERQLLLAQAERMTEENGARCDAILAQMREVTARMRERSEQLTREFSRAPEITRPEPCAERPPPIPRVSTYRGARARGAGRPRARRTAGNRAPPGDGDSEDPEPPDAGGSPLDSIARRHACRRGRA